MTDLKVFLGWDPRENDAYEVARASILEYAPEVQVTPIVRSELENLGVYDRHHDTRGASEFTITRFFVPYLSRYKGLSLFMDCDILCTTDIREILKEVDPKNAVSCVKHDYIPKTAMKMDGQTQHNYPRKNWSSVMVFNNSMCKVLTPDIVNSATPKYLHRMYWAQSIGSLSHTWNYLSGYYNDIERPNVIHYTDGGPWFEGYEDCDFASDWIKFYEKINISGHGGRESRQ
jgi:hypothetical protein